MKSKPTRDIRSCIRGLVPPAVQGQAYGIEVELENVRNPVPPPGWNVIGDGSLRNDGVEFLTPPVNADTVRRMMAELYESKERNGYTGGQRCGIHVHMDMTSRPLPALHAFLVAYACVEPILFDECGPEREQNIFCIPWYRAATGLDQIREFFHKPGRDACMRMRRGQAKYTSLYVEPLGRFGTVEFRGAPVFDTVAEFNVFFGMLEELLTNTADADAAEIVDIFSMDPEHGLTVFMPSGRERWELIDDADSQGIAASLVRTKPLPPTWEFLGLNIDDTDPRDPEAPPPYAPERVEQQFEVRGRLAEGRLIHPQPPRRRRI